MYILIGPLGMQQNVQTSMGRFPELLKDECILCLMNKVWRHQIPLTKSSNALPLISLSGKTGWAHPEERGGWEISGKILSYQKSFDGSSRASCWFPQLFSQLKMHGLAMMSSDMDRHAEARSCQVDPGLWWRLGEGMCNLRVTWVWSE